MDHAVTLLTSLVERERSEDGTLRSVNLSGDPDQAAIVAAVLADYHHRTGRPEVTAELLEALVDQRASLVVTTRGMLGHTSIQAIEATVKQIPRGLAMLPKGRRSRGYLLDPAKVVDLEPGFGAIPVLKQRVDGVRAAFPQVRLLTADRLRAVPGADVAHGCTLAVFGTHRMPDGPAPGAIWLIESYDPADDIVDNVLILRPEYGFSERGSVYGRDLLRCGGEIVGAPVVSFDDAVALADQDYETALAVVTGQVHLDPLDRPVTTTVGTTTPEDGADTAHRHDPTASVEDEVDQLTPDIADRLADIDKALDGGT